jgi:hypothetical protein
MLESITVPETFISPATMEERDTHEIQEQINKPES